MREPFRYQHADDGPTVLINYKGNGEDRDATDFDRCVILVVGIEGTRQQVWEWESGKVQPGSKHLAKLSEVLGLEIADLVPISTTQSTTLFVVRWEDRKVQFAIIQTAPRSTSHRRVIRKLSHLRRKWSPASAPILTPAP